MTWTLWGRGPVRRRVYEIPYPEPPLPALPPASEPSKCLPSPQTQSAFFNLAPELCEMILLEAFGNRTVHIDLRSRRSMHKMATRTFPISNPFTPVRQGWRKIVPWVDPKTPSPEWHDEKENVPLWRWYGCFCHCDDPDRVMLEDVDSVVWEIEKGFFADGCWRGRRWCCHPEEVGAPPEGYGVGVMGFMLSCKRGHRETLRILYSTNTISIESQSLIHGLMRQNALPGAPKIICPGMQLVTSLQLTSDLALWHYEMDWRQVEDRALLAEQLELLPRAFPHLQRLEWTFRPERWLPYYALPLMMWELTQAEEFLFRPLLQACGKMSALKEVTVALPFNIFFCAVAMEGCRPGPREELFGEQLADIRIWYPFTQRSGEKGAEGGGFWLAYGEEEARDWRLDGTARGRQLPS